MGECKLRDYIFLTKYFTDARQSNAFLRCLKPNFRALNYKILKVLFYK